MPFLFEKLEVYQLAVDVAVELDELTDAFPRRTQALADQLRRASISISANIAEGNARFTKADRRNFFVIARGSASECIPLLEIARRRALVEAGRADELKRRLDRIARMLTALIAGLEHPTHP
ncbi:MAG: hypothetical protein RLZZ116_2675 [Planctomycetota bacterium]|jgi:four helix bundle protein